MDEWTKKKDNWLDKPDYGWMAKKLNAVKAGYEEWDSTVRSIESTAKAAGIDPKTLEFAHPNREQWNAVNNTIFNKG